MLVDLISVEDKQLVARCLEMHYARRVELYARMRREISQTDQADDTTEWTLIPSPLGEADISALEAELPVSLPPLFRAFLVTYCVLSMDFGGFFLPTISSDAPLKDIETYLFQTSLWKIEYVQFASSQDGDPVCFDLQAPTPDGDFAVVTINHDCVRWEDWDHRDRVEKQAQREADSFRSFFTQLYLDEGAA